MFGELIFDGIAGIFHNEKGGHYTFIFKKCLIIEGKGKEYYSMGEFSFRGHFLRRKKEEKEKELLFFGTITFESKWFEEKSQNDKEYFYEGELDFDGEHIDRKEWIEKGEKKHLFNLEGEYFNREKKDIDIPEFNLGKLAFEGEYLKKKEMEKKENIMKVN